MFIFVYIAVHMFIFAVRHTPTLKDYFSIKRVIALQNPFMMQTLFNKLFGLQNIGYIYEFKGFLIFCSIKNQLDRQDS